MPKINALHLTTTFLRFRGESHFIIEYTKRLAQKGVEIDVVTPHDREKTVGFEIVGGVRIHRFQYFFPGSLQRVAYNGGVAFNLANSFSARLQFPLFMLSFFLKAAKNVRGKDLIHAHWLPGGMIAVILKKFTGKPVVFFVHQMVCENFWIKALNRFVLQNSDLVIFNSSYTLKKAREFCRPKKFRVIWPSVDLSLFRKIPVFKARKKIGVKANQKIVFAVGRFVEKKGFSYLIRAMKKLKAKNAVCIIGGFGPLETELQNLVKESHLEEKVLFAGEIPNKELPYWMNASDVVVVPSIIDSNGETETLGIVAVEAMACGKPVIASKIGGLVDVIQDGFNGFTVRQKDADGLAAKIDAVLSSGFSKKTESNARKFAEKRFSLERAVNETLWVYRQVLKNTQRRKKRP